MGPTAPPTASATPWLVSRRVDLAMFLGPLAVAALTLALPVPRGIPLWAFVGVIVAFDVAHVWATAYRTYLDPTELGRRPVLYLLPIPLFLVLSYRLHLVSPTHFWTLLAYVAIYHFIRQNYGFVVLYRQRAGPAPDLDRWLDWIAAWAGALGPVLWWHASPTRQFDWFHAGERFIAQIDPALEPDVLVAYLGVAAFYVARQGQLALAGSFNPGKNLVMAGHWLTWWVGIQMFDHPLVSAAFLNLFHGIPFLVLVFAVGRHSWRDRWPRGVVEEAVADVFRKGRVVVFFLPLFAVALAEETLWDALVWGQYLPRISDWTLPDLSRSTRSMIVAVLSLPQILHYFLDAWIWRLNGTNPELDAFLGAPDPCP